MSPDCLLGVVPQPTDSRLSETISIASLHSARGAMVDLSHESGPKSEAGRGRHCCSDAENGDSPRMFASIMQIIVRPILMIT